VPELFGSYTVHEELGMGGMATVHLAQGKEGPAAGKRVALKRLLPHIQRTPELLSAFIDEARLARYLRHPNIAQVYEFGRISGKHFIAFEFVPGPTVEQLFQHCQDAVGLVPVSVVVAIIAQLCDALEYAHAMHDDAGTHLRIIHRDVSPSNLIVANTGFVKLIDFGLAKAKYQSVESQVGIIKGKLSYIAPEYLAGKLDARCDLWAVGVMLHELLAGRRLFASDDEHAKVGLIQSMPIPPPSQYNAEVSSALDRVVLTALERDPSKRWQSARDLRMALLAASSHYREMSKPQLVAWIEWAFVQTQKEREDSGVSALHDILESGITAVNAADGDDDATVAKQLPATAAAMMERRRESMSAIEGMPPLERPKASRLGWVAIVVAGLLAGAGLAYALVHG
jgi:eukaryotic-like serine/threonine-protein kinase